jgi:hypothetical protein
VYDVATQAWHERAGFENGQFTRHRSNCQMAFNNKIVVGDFENGNIYAFDLEDYSDNGSIQKWLRTWRALPTGQNNFKRTAQHTLQLNCEAGVGLNGIAYPVRNNSAIANIAIASIAVAGTNSLQPSDAAITPQVMLRWSDDGGHTWSSEHWAPIGRIGVYGQRTFWRRLGMTLKLRDRVYELSGTDPVKIAITGAELILSPTTA